MRTSGYIQITGWFDQTTIGLTPDDTGGELDPHGDDKVSLVASPEYSVLTWGSHDSLEIRLAGWCTHLASRPVTTLPSSKSTAGTSEYCATTRDLIPYRVNSFVGSGQFCIKLCDPKVTSPNYCLK